MNQFLVISLLLLVSGIGAQKCCPYPFLPIATPRVNITAANFHCSEPISFKCSVFIDGFPTVGLAGYSVAGSKAYDIVASRRSSLEGAVICNTKSQKWITRGAKKEYPHFSCAFQALDGKWVIA